MVEIWLFILGFLAGGFAVQTMLLRLTASRWKALRWAALLPAAILLLLAWEEYSTPDVLIGLSGLAALFYLALAVCVLLGCGAAWGVYALRRRRERKGGAEHEG